MKITKDHIEISTLHSILALIGIFICVGLYIGNIKSDIALANQTNDTQQQDIDFFKENIVTKEEFKDFKETNDKFIELIRLAYPKY